MIVAAAMPLVMLAPSAVVFGVTLVQNSFACLRPSRVLLNWYDVPSTCFTAVPEDALGRGIGEFCAWLIGRICHEALKQLDDRCRVLDYRDLTPDAALRVAEFFSVRLSDEKRERFHSAFVFDAKRGGEFQREADRNRKHAAAASVAGSVARWADAPYGELLSRGRKLWAS